MLPKMDSKLGRPIGDLNYTLTFVKRTFEMFDWHKHAQL